MLGDRIRELRTSRGMTQSELAAKLHLTPKMVSFYELGQRTPPLDILELLCKIFDVSPNSLLGMSAVSVPASSGHAANIILSDAELTLLAKYRKLSAENQRFVDICINKALEVQNAKT